VVESSDPGWSRVDALLSQALERPERERVRWIREACGSDQALADEVVRLLELGVREDGTLDSNRLGPMWQDALGALDGEPLESEPGPRAGQKIGPYEVIDVIGRGGMGTVYRARDATLGREVAVKALSSAFTGDPSGLKRFAREARLLASLNHPNIATIYDLLEFEGRPYLILELVEGETLADRVARGPLPFDECLRVARQLAEALEEAHEKGVVHRDLKPSNVKLTAEGRVKVLDFGLAKSQATPALTGASPSSATTRSGLVLGTPAYMSPEQARGHSVDSRTDIWSFGCLLYEMLSGERAFRGGSGFDVVASVLRDEVAWTKLPGGIPASVQRLLRRCLEKNAASRPQAFSEIRQVLDEAASVAFSGPRFLATPAASWRPVLIAAGLALALALAAVLSLRLQRAREAAEPEQLRIAVLPFRSLDPGDQDEYLADGLTEDLISQLGRVQPAKLTVVARHSAMTYKGSEKQLDEIARELPVQYVVDGSVRRQGEQLRITSRLVRVSDQATLWTESYDRRLGDLLALQAEVAGEIARRIRISVAPPLGGARVTRGSVSPAAYDAYLRGRYHQQRGSAASTERALEEFEKAVALEPGFALAWAGLSRARIFGSREQPAEAQALARHAAQQAVDLDGSSSEARLALGLVLLYADWDWEGARRELESAAALDPGNPEGHFYLAQALGAAGRLDEAIASARRAQELDPFSPLIRHYVGRFFYYQRDYDAAILEYRQAIDLDPGYPWSELFLSLTYEQTGRFEEAIRHRQRALSLMGAPPKVVQELGDAFATGGEEAVLRKRAADGEARAAELGYVTSTELAQVWVQLGDPDRALGWLERAFEDHTRDLIYLAVEPAFEPLRQSPRFEALESRMGHPAVGAVPPAA